MLLISVYLWFTLVVDTWIAVLFGCLCCLLVCMVALLCFTIALNDFGLCLYCLIWAIVFSLGLLWLFGVLVVS